MPIVLLDHLGDRHGLGCVATTVSGIPAMTAVTGPGVAKSVKVDRGSMLARYWQASFIRCFCQSGFHSLPNIGALAGCPAVSCRKERRAVIRQDDMPLLARSCS